MIDITPVVNAVIALIAALISVFIIPWIKANTTAHQQKTMIELIQVAVSAAEQIYSGAGRGEEKKQYVLEFLASKGVKVDDEAVNAAIESAVQQLNSGKLRISD